MLQIFVSLKRVYSPRRKIDFINLIVPYDCYALHTAQYIHGKLICTACMHAQLPQSCPTLCNPKDYSPPGSSVHGILQARILEWVAMPSSRESSQPRDRTHVFCTSGGFFIAEPPGKPLFALCFIKSENFFFSLFIIYLYVMCT